MIKPIKAQKNVKQFRNIGLTQILTYRLPLAGIASILHRISGALLFLLLPFALYLFEQSLLSESSFATLKSMMSCVVIKLIVLAMSWAFCFHFLSLLQWLLNCSEFCNMATHQAVGSKRLVVGAHYGLFSWLMQRITAVVMAAYTVILLICFFSARRFSHAGWVAIFANRWMKLAASIALLALCYHAWVGMRNIWMDYIKPFSIRLTLMTLSLLWLLGCAGYGVQILWNSNLSGASHSPAGGAAPPCRTAVLSASARLASTAVRSSYLS